MTSLDQKMNDPAAFELPELFTPNPRLHPRLMFRGYAEFSRLHILNDLGRYLLNASTSGHSVIDRQAVTANLKAAAAGGWFE